MTDFATALYGTPSTSATSALTHNAPAAPAAARGDAASALYGDGKPAPAAPAAPAARAPAAPVARAPAAPAPAPINRGRGREPDAEPAALADPDADEAFNKKPKPHGNAAYAARAAERAADDEQQEQQVEPKGDEQDDVPTLTDDAKVNLAQVIRDVESVSVQRLGMSTADAAANAEHSAAWFDALGVTPNDASYITEVAVAAATQGISDEQDAVNHSAAMDALRTDFGPSNADRAVQLAQKLVAKHPSIRRYLAESGLGNHPKVVACVAQRAWQLAAEGKL